MKRYRKIRLNLSSNLNNYSLLVCDCNDAKIYPITANFQTIYVCTGDTRLSIVASANNFNTAGQNYVIDVLCAKDININFNFVSNQTQTPSISQNEFRVVDANYGLGVSGVLTFTKI